MFKFISGLLTQRKLCLRRWTAYFAVRRGLILDLLIGANVTHDKSDRRVSARLAGNIATVAGL
jgi:hypothetical protein